MTRLWKIYTEPRVLRFLFLGFSAGLPLLLVFGTLSFWLREAGVDLKTIGFASWIGLAYAFKWVWSPLVDKVSLPLLTAALGRRRSWLILAQACVMIALLGLSVTDPSVHLTRFMMLAVVVAFCSATQDIALDAFRIESAPKDVQGSLAAMYQTGYRLAMIWAGAGALALADWASSTSGYDFAGWAWSYRIMAISMVVGMVTVLCSPEPTVPVKPDSHLPLWVRIREATVGPLTDFWSRFGRVALIILGVIATYRIADVVLGVMANPFYADMGFTKAEVSAVSKIFGVIMTLVGAFLGGALTLRWGILKTLFWGGVLTSLTNLLFSVLAQIGHSVEFLVLTVSADNLASGMASAAFVAYLSSLTSRSFSASQYAIFSSLMLLLPKFLAGFSGVFVEQYGFQMFFTMTATLGIPALLLIFLSRKSAVIQKALTS